MKSGWTGYLQELNRSLNTLELEIKKAKLEMKKSGRSSRSENSKWRSETGQNIDRLSNVLFTAHEITYSNAAENTKLEQMIERLRNVQESYDQLNLQALH